MTDEHKVIQEQKEKIASLEKELHNPQKPVDPFGSFGEHMKSQLKEIQPLLDQLNATKKTLTGATLIIPKKMDEIKVNGKKVKITLSENGAIQLEFINFIEGEKYFNYLIK